MEKGNNRIRNYKLHKLDLQDMAYDISVLFPFKSTKEMVKI